MQFLYTVLHANEIHEKLCKWIAYGQFLTLCTFHLSEQRQEAKCGDNYPPFVTKDTVWKGGGAVFKKHAALFNIPPKAKGVLLAQMSQG